MPDEKREEALRKELDQVLAAGDTEKGTQIARQALESGLTPTEFFVGIIQPLLYDVGKRFERLEIFLPDLMKAAKVIQTMQREVLEPAILAESGEGSELGTVVIGTCQGDIHDIGKNMVALMLQVNGFRVIDLGTDVSPQNFIDAARKEEADIIGMSSLLTPSMPYMGDLIKRLEGLGLREQYKVIVGGAPVTEAYAERIGADAYGADAVHAVQMCRQLIGLEG
ncbi:MAG TPA: cobalamin-binding protein [Chloroflexi bacterium]|nr:cobalamin-binding protein [Chloroflexota bacterium]